MILSSYSKEALAIFLVVPEPFFLGFTYAGSLVTMYSFPLWKNFNFTYVLTSSLEKLEPVII